jgi:alpha-beta hydrolase superfamily lysophospholipase
MAEEKPMVFKRAFAAIAAACSFAFVVACAPVVAPRGIANDTPAFEADALVTRDGLHLPLRHWDAENPKAVIVALHGMSDYSEAFDLPGPWLAAHGISVYAYDQRGFGQTPDPGIWAGGDAMRNDLDDAVEAARAKFPGLPVYALGESMGGAVVLSSLDTPHPPDVDGIVLVAAAVWSRADMPISYRAALWLSAHTMPWLHVSGNGLHIQASDNIAMLQKLSRDPLFQHSARTDQVYGLVNLMDAAHNAPAKTSDPPPILFLYGAKDQVIPAKPTEEVIKSLGARARVERYPDGYHMLLRDLDREKVLSDLDAWVNAEDKRIANARE